MNNPAPVWTPGNIYLSCLPRPRFTAPVLRLWNTVMGLLGGLLQKGKSNQHGASTRSSRIAEISDAQHCSTTFSAPFLNEPTLTHVSPQISMFVLETPDNTPSSSDFKRSIASAVLEQFVHSHASQEASQPSRPSSSTSQPPLSPSATASVVLSQSKALSHTSFLLMLILSVMECHLAHATPPATLEAVAAAVQRCQSPSGPALLKSYSTMELRFMVDSLAQHFGTTPNMTTSDSPQQVGDACSSMQMSRMLQR